MRLTCLTVKGFRSFRNETKLNLHDYTTLVGANNCGKSTFLRAIELLLSTNKPVSADWHGNAPTAEPIIITADFAEVSTDEASIPGIAGIVDGKTIRIRKVARWEDGKIEVINEAWKAPLLNDWKDANFSSLPPEIRARVDESGLVENGRQWSSKKGDFIFWMQENYPDELSFGSASWSSDNISIPAALQQGLPQVVSVPAIRDAENHTKNGSKTAFGVLLATVLIPKLKACEEYESVVNALNRLQSRLVGDDGSQPVEIVELANQLSRSLQDVLSRSATAVFGLTPPDLEKPLAAGFDIQLDDGIRTPVGHQGHGMQSALVYSLLDAVAAGARSGSASGSERSTILLYEEPELFLHPHLMRRLRGVLKRIAQGEGWQVVVTTHSPFLVDVADEPRSLGLFRRDRDDHPTISQLEVDPFSRATAREEERSRLRAALDFHPSVCEAFFARHAVLVEGDTEVAILSQHPRLLQACGVEEGDAREVTIVSCGGKWTIAPVALTCSPRTGPAIMEA